MFNAVELFSRIMSADGAPLYWLGAIMEEIAALDAESAEVLKTIRRLL